jgi:hypothetical protein
VRRTVVLADIGLDLDDPAAPTRPVARIVNEMGAKKPAGDLERGSGEERRGLAQEPSP